MSATAHSGCPVETPELRSESFTISVPRTADFARVLEIFAALGPNYECDPESSVARSVYMNYVRGLDKRGFVAKVDSVVAGVILFELSPMLSRRYIQIRHDGLAVDLAYRKRGIGVGLLRKVLAFSCARGATNVLIKASEPGVIALYRSLPEIEERGIYFYYTPPEGSARNVDFRHS
ncbi:GNAT family N-acetyltransferase [Paraburkholderia denitrificans]|uniref:GNAT family N-acetyltransferase n=1 Tax=Paraburkholderia denitrificans TaxID=694025 RepID=A0ABW0J751_9BURK